MGKQRTENRKQWKRERWERTHSPEDIRKAYLEAAIRMDEFIFGEESTLHRLRDVTFTVTDTSYMTVEEYLDMENSEDK